jgi:hypothetical protein
MYADRVIYVESEKERERERAHNYGYLNRCIMDCVVADLPCGYSEGPNSNNFFDPGYELHECAPGTEWSQEVCACVLGKH